MDWDVMLRGSVRLELHESGYWVIEAGDADSALSVSVQEPPDLMVLELALPDLAALQLLSDVIG